MINKKIQSQQSAINLDSLHESEQKLQALLHVLPVGVSILGKNRKPLFVNQTLEKMLELSTTALHKGLYQKRKYLRSDGSEMPMTEFPSARAFKEQQAIKNVEVGVVKEDGQVVWTMVSAVPFESGNWSVLLTVADISQQKDAENTLQQRTDELVERIQELNCFYGISELVEKPGITLEEILQGTTELLPSSWRFSGMTSARITFEGKEYKSKGFKTSEKNQCSDIYVHAQPIGSVEVFYAGEHPEAEKQSSLKEKYSLLHAIAERLGRIIERFQAERLLMKLATTDPLTGLYNRRHFFDLAEMEVARSARYGHPLACIMFDIDHFKEINDSRGHLFGDRVLQAMVWRCLDNIRRVDIFARYGGDEFVILLPETGIRRCKQLAERLCTSFQAHSMEIEGHEISITLSMGVASMLGDDELALDTLLNRADQALYVAKENGRNQFAIWQENP